MQTSDFNSGTLNRISPRILLGPGPSMVAPRVLSALARPLLGHLDPEFLQVMEEERILLRQVFRTQNELTLVIPGTGSAGMETALANLIEPGEAALVVVVGFFGERMCEMVGRYGGQVERLEAPWGQVADPERVIDHLNKKRYQLVALVHAETSTGVLQPGIAEIAVAAHRQGTLVVLDTVTSLGGLPVEVDAWGVDIAYSATQKCLSAPPGLSPITVSPRAWEKIRSRKTPVRNWYLDLTGLERYWNSPHAYHHTAPVNLHFALREALRMALEEGLEARFVRHRSNAEMLWAGLEALNLPPLVSLQNRLTTLTTPRLKAGMDDAALRGQLLEKYNIEVAGGFGPLKGKVWRVGLMGYSSQPENVHTLLTALGQLLS